MKSAKEMFKELGYEKAEKSESVVLYTNGYGDTISFKETKHVVITHGDGGGTVFMNCLLENAIHKQCEELGWLEEEKTETNYEHYKDEIIENYMNILAVVKGTPKACYKTNCNDCDFKINQKGCRQMVKEWLKKPYQKQTFKLTKFEHDLLQSYSDIYSFNAFNSLSGMKEKGYFKGIDDNKTIGEILAKCEVVG